MSCRGTASKNAVTGKIPGPDSRDVGARGPRPRKPLFERNPGFFPKKTARGPGYPVSRGLRAPGHAGQELPSRAREPRVLKPVIRVPCAPRPGATVSGEKLRGPHKIPVPTGPEPGPGGFREPCSCPSPPTVQNRAEMPRALGSSTSTGPRLFGRPSRLRQPAGLGFAFCWAAVLRRPPCRSAQKCVVALRFSSSPGRLLVGRPNRPRRAKVAHGGQLSDPICLRPGHKCPSLAA
jgi:hypothetical protein